MRTHRDTTAVITTAIRLVVISALASMLPSVWTTGLSAEVETSVIRKEKNKQNHHMVQFDWVICITLQSLSCMANDILESIFNFMSFSFSPPHLFFLSYAKILYFPFFPHTNLVNTS